MSKVPDERYQHEVLPQRTSFRVFELLPGVLGDPITCSLRTASLDEYPSYEAMSYAWGDPAVKTSVIIDGKHLDVTVNLKIALEHLRYPDRSRVLWADAICINQTDKPERSEQVAQMRRIYENARAVLIWVGQDSDNQAKTAVESLNTLSNFLCDKLGIPASKLGTVDNLYQEIMAKARNVLPLPNECDFSSVDMWKSLLWFYKHPYFTRLWAIQEINANKNRLVHCGLKKIIWDRVSLVACYITMETSFSKAFGFSDTYCWFAATVTTDLVQPKNWLLVLYLASNFSSTDTRDMIYGLRGMIDIDKGAELLAPNYSKLVTEVYRDSVEAALVNFGNTNVLLYVHGSESPSWIPRWDIAMLFRNPFRFGKLLPWRPAGETTPTWHIDKDSNVLSLSGFVIRPIRFVEPYNESCFGNTMTETDSGRRILKSVWQIILESMEKGLGNTPFSTEELTAAAMSFSFGLNEKSDPEDEKLLLHRFVAYLKLTLDEEIYTRCIPPEIDQDTKDADGRLFGKPVWDFNYPESSFFITEDRFVGCSIASTNPGDVVFVARGSTYPLVLRPEGDGYRIRGFAYVHGLMHGEEKDRDVQPFRIY